jgi:hypothetical protein
VCIEQTSRLKRNSNAFLRFALAFIEALRKGAGRNGAGFWERIEAAKEEALWFLGPTRQ